MEVGLNIGAAIRMMRAGRKVARKGWNGRGIYIAMYKPVPWDETIQEYIYEGIFGLVTDDENNPESTGAWVPSQTDLLAEDWVTVG